MVSIEIVRVLIHDSSYEKFPLRIDTDTVLSNGYITRYDTIQKKYDISEYNKAFRSERLCFNGLWGTYLEDDVPLDILINTIINIPDISHIHYGVRWDIPYDDECDWDMPWNSQGDYIIDIKLVGAYLKSLGAISFSFRRKKVKGSPRDAKLYHLLGNDRIHDLSAEQQRII